MMADRNGLQDLFLNAVRRSHTPVTLFLIKGVKLQGVITWFDSFSLLLRRDGQMQLVYKHSISTIMPSAPVDVGDGAERLHRLPNTSKALQEVFLTAARKSSQPVTMFLVNGVMLTGEVIAFDLFSLLLFRDGAVQLVYKHAISTISPEGPLNLRHEPPADIRGAAGQGADGQVADGEGTDDAGADGTDADEESD